MRIANRDADVLRAERQSGVRGEDPVLDGNIDIERSASVRDPRTLARIGEQARRVSEAHAPAPSSHTRRDVPKHLHSCDGLNVEVVHAAADSAFHFDASRRAHRH